MLTSGLLWQFVLVVHTDKSLDYHASRAMTTTTEDLLFVAILR